jgi:hypothetical protein
MLPIVFRKMLSKLKTIFKKNYCKDLILAFVTIEKIVPNAIDTEALTR